MFINNFDPVAFSLFSIEIRWYSLAHIFGILFGYFLMDEIITWKVIVSLVVILIGIYIFKKNNKG